MSKVKFNKKTLLRYEQRGNVAILFALLGSAAVGLLGTTVELTRLATSRASLDSAADAAALAAKRVQMDRSMEGDAIARAAGEAVGQKIFAASAPGADEGVTGASAAFSWDSDGSARVVATGQLQLVLGGVVGMSTRQIRGVGVATAGADRELEVSLLLDTTASMFNTDGRSTTRFSLMRASAKSFVNTLFDTISVPNRLRVAVVPWTTTVNIKNEAPQGWNNSAGTVRTPERYLSNPICACWLARLYFWNRRNSGQYRCRDGKYEVGRIARSTPQPPDNDTGCHVCKWLV
jgi:Flp pilus assembly protein TadG